MALTFWYDFSSSYSYLAAMRIEAVAEKAKVQVVWQPFLLGPIFIDAGYNGSPNLMAPAKAAYMWTDIARRAAHRGHPFKEPTPFPQKSVLAARAALALPARDRPAFSRAAFMRIFAKGENIAEAAVVAAAIAEAGLDPEVVLAAAGKPEVKAALRESVETAKSLGIFGAPTFVTTDEALFWGDDRLEDALAWEKTGSLPAGG